MIYSTLPSEGMRFFGGDVTTKHTHGPGLEIISWVTEEWDKLW